MQVALLHNSSAGSEDHTDAELEARIEKANHEVVHLVKGVAGLKAALHERPCDLVVVAGGDGTVGRAACELSGWPVPIAVLPLGTANNTAHSLGLPMRVKQGIKSWAHAARVPYDLGLVDDGGQRVRFAECVGWGVFARTIVEARRQRDAGGVEQKLKRDRKLFRSVLARSRPGSYRVVVDGRDCSGEYLLVEVVNIAFIGPRLAVSPESDSSDGELEVVLVSATESACLESLARSGEPSPHYRIERGRHIVVETSDALLHRDGRLERHAPGRRRFELEVEPAAVHYLR